MLLLVQRSQNWWRDCAWYMFGKLSSRRIEWYDSRPHKSKDDRGNQGNVKKWRKRAKIATLWGTITHAPQTFSKSPLVFLSRRKRSLKRYPARLQSSIHKKVMFEKLKIFLHFNFRFESLCRLLCDMTELNLLQNSFSWIIRCADHYSGVRFAKSRNRKFWKNIQKLNILQFIKSNGAPQSQGSLGRLVYALDI